MNTSIPLRSSRSGKGRTLLRRLFGAAGIALFVVLLLALLRVGPEPALQIDPAAPGIGQRTSIVASASEPSRGLSDVRLELLQNDRVFSLAEASFEPRAFWAFWGPRRQEHVLEIEVGRDSLEELVEGTATLRLVAARSGTWLRRPRAATTELELPVRFRPPSSSVLSDLIYVRQGGSEAVVYRVGPTTSEHGVQSGERWFPGYPLPGGGEGEMFALFAVPHDLTDSDQVRLVVRDELGNQSRSAFLDRFTPSPLKRSNIQLNDRFMEKVVAEILDRTPELRPEDSTLETYLKINGELREANRRRLRELGSRSRQEFLWSQPFLQLRNSQVMDSFAARRSYRFEGLQVDTQDHLGFDFASVRRAPVDAANDGIVVLAEYFGIYGNAIVLDHGYGLMTLYAHLSSIEVEEGQTVQRGDSLGRSGETGLAGGDHLHFGVLLQGVPVSPVEWFDAKWIRDRIVRKMPNAFDFDG